MASTTTSTAFKLGLSLLAAGLACARQKAGHIDYHNPAPGAIGVKSPEEELSVIMDKVERGELPRIQFEFDSDKITLESYPTLDAVADLLLRYPKLKLLVRAHTCIIGTEAYNLGLSHRRAKSVKAYLVKNGVHPPFIRFRGYGFSQPIADNATEEGRTKNRRVEFRVTYRDWPSIY